MPHLSTAKFLNQLHELQANLYDFGSGDRRKAIDIELDGRRGR
jgi:hypothetical protein